MRGGEGRGISQHGVAWSSLGDQGSFKDRFYVGSCHGPVGILDPSFRGAVTEGDKTVRERDRGTDRSTDRSRGPLRWTGRGGTRTSSGKSGREDPKAEFTERTRRLHEPNLISRLCGGRGIVLRNLSAGFL